MFERSLDELIAALRSADAAERLEARQDMGAHKGPAAVERVAALARDAGAPIDARADAVEALEKCGELGVAAIAGLLDEAEPKVRAAAVLALGHVDSKALAPRLAALLKDASPFVRLAAVRQSSVAPDRVGLLREALADAASPVRRQAAREIAGLPGKGWSEALARAFESGAGSVADRAERVGEEEALLQALMSCKAEPGFASEASRLAPRLIALAGDKSAYDTGRVEAGRIAAELLALVGAPGRAAELAPLLEREGLALHVRKQVVLALVKSSPADAATFLQEAMARAREGDSLLPVDVIQDGLARAQRARG
jgi:HEAT repeat protein